MLTKLVFFLLVARASCQLSKEILDIIGEPEKPEIQARSYHHGIVEKETCKELGYWCKSCRTIVNCIENLDGSFEPEYIRCNPRETCERSTGKCTSGYNPDCDPTLSTFQFRCRQEGIFPDPFQCRKYHICLGFSNSVSTGYLCPTGYGFDVNTLQCTVKLVNNKCERPIEPCKEHGETGIVGGTGRIIYVCKQEFQDNHRNIYPNFVHCFGDYKFVNGKCRDMAKYEEFTNGGQCYVVGEHAAENFYQYYKCHSNLYAFLNNCNHGQYFNMKLSKCTPFHY